MRGLIGCLVLVLLDGVLTGCTPVVVETSLSPVLTSPSPVVTTSTPAWTVEEQAAIDAVHRYLEVWADIGQNLPEADLLVFYDVASDPAANDAFLQWGEWMKKGWHLVGAPSFTPDLVTSGARDHLGERFHVHGCFSIEGSYLVDSDGNQVGDRGTERGTGRTTVLHLTNDRYLVIEEVSEDDPC